MTVTHQPGSKEPPLFPVSSFPRAKQHNDTRKSRSQWSLLLISNLALIVGVFAFAIGFFPYKPFLPGLSTFHDGMDEVKAPFDKVVFMVVDALRRYTETFFVNIYK